MEKIPIRVGPNGLLPLGELVSFRVMEEIVPILRDNGQRREAIMVNLGGRDVEGYVNQVKQMPLGHNGNGFCSSNHTRIERRTDSALQFTLT